MCRFHQRRLAHAAGAPEQCVVGGQALGKALGVFHQHVPDAVDAFEQRHLDAVDARNRSKPAIGVPHEGISGAKIGQCRALRCQPLERGGDALEHVALAGGTRGAFGFGVDRRVDRDFDLAIWVFPQIALLLAGRRCPRKRPCGEMAENGGF